jgi:hypothetical protein
MEVDQAGARGGLQNGAESDHTEDAGGCQQQLFLFLRAGGEYEGV